MGNEVPAYQPLIDKVKEIVYLPKQTIVKVMHSDFKPTAKFELSEHLKSINDKTLLYKCNNSVRAVVAAIKKKIGNESNRYLLECVVFQGEMQVERLTFSKLDLLGNQNVFEESP